MKKLLFIDDVRTLTVAEETEYGLVTYCRTLEAAMAVNWQEYNEIWLDHDLGGDDTIRPFVLKIEEYAFTNIIYKHYEDRPVFRIISSNPIGIEWMKQALRKFSVLT